MGLSCPAGQEWTHLSHGLEYLQAHPSQKWSEWPQGHPWSEGAVFKGPGCVLGVAENR